MGFVPALKKPSKIHLQVPRFGCPLPTEGMSPLTWMQCNGSGAFERSMFCIKDTVLTCSASVSTWEGENYTQTHSEGTNPARVTQGSVTASPWNALCSQCRGINNFPLNSPPNHYPVLADALLQAQVLPKKNPKTIGREEKMAFGSCRSPVLFCGCSFTESVFTQAGRNHRRWELCGREIKQQSKCHGEILLLNPQCPSSQHGSRAAAPWLDFKNRKVTSFQSQSAVLCFQCHFRPWECSQRAHSSSGKRWKMPPSRICCLN